MKKNNILMIIFMSFLIITGVFTYAKSCDSVVSVLNQIVDSIPTTPLDPVTLKDNRHSLEIPILMYHGICQRASKETEYFISKDRFEEDLKWLSSHGYTTIFPSQLIDYVNSSSKLPSKPVILTFDDGYCNNYLYAFPLLQKYQMKAFISLIGAESQTASNDIYRVPDVGNLTLGEITLMYKSSCLEFGNHTYNLHNAKQGRKGADRKKGEPLDAYTQVLTEDLLKTQDLIKHTIGTAPQVFVWPYGAYPADGSGDLVLKKLGFKASFNSYQRTCTVSQGDADSLFGLGRYLRTPKFSLEDHLSP